MLSIILLAHAAAGAAPAPRGTCRVNQTEGLALIQLRTRALLVAPWEQREQCFQGTELLSTEVANTLQRGGRLKAAPEEYVFQHAELIKGMQQQYNAIFAPSLNRNAASHLWAEYILSRRQELSHEEMVEMFTGFCPVSGSTLPVAGATPFRSKLPLATDSSSHATGFTYHCCWPCICDTTDLLKVDYKTFADKTGTNKTHAFVVIGNPCASNPPTCMTTSSASLEECMPEEAPAVVCNKEGELTKAMKSDGGHIIIGMYFVEGSQITPVNYVDYETQAMQDGKTIKAACEKRREAGYNSGMGAIFQQVARINPIGLH